MLKGVNKKISASILAVISLLALGCGGKNKEADEATIQAQSLLEKATSALKNGDTGTAQALVDSLNKSYPEQIEARREAMNLQLLINEQAIAEEIIEVEDAITQAEDDYTSIVEKMQKVVDPELNDYYWIAKEGTTPKFIETTGIQARVLDNGDFCLVSEVIEAGNLHHNSVTLTLDGESVTSGSVPYDGELNYRLNGSETVTYGSEKAKEIGQFAADHPDHAMTLTFNGENGKTKQMKLTAKQVQAIADTYNMSVIQKNAQSLYAKRQLLQRKKALAEDQKNRSAETSK